MNAMPEYRTILRTSDVKPGKGTPVEINNKRFAVYLVDGKFYAIADECLHRGAPLHEGILDGRAIICPLHDWIFDVTTGELLNSLSDIPARLKKYDLIIENDEIKIDAENFS
jgi:3-phenylpropionate/trans-cinnamate dioxygenase ferredoxin component